MARILNCVVRDGKQLAHNGAVLAAGEVVELPEHVAYEVRADVLLVGSDGALAPVDSMFEEPGSIEALLSWSLPHEHRSLIDAHRAKLLAQLAALDNMAPPAPEVVPAVTPAVTAPVDVPAGDEPAAVEPSKVDKPAKSAHKAK